MKLTAAKCPNCGASLEVNKDLEKTICQYCGSTVMIEEAIEKYKVELSGKVEVDGIKGRDAKLKQAQKHIKIEEYASAQKILEEIVSEDKFDVEAYCELIKVYLGYLDDLKTFSEDTALADPRWNYAEKIESYYNRIKKIAEDDSYVDILKDYQEKIERVISLMKKLPESKKKVEDTMEKLSKLMKRAKSVYLYSNEYLDIASESTSLKVSEFVKKCNSFMEKVEPEIVAEEKKQEKIDKRDDMIGKVKNSIITYYKLSCIFTIIFVILIFIFFLIKH